MASASKGWITFFILFKPLDLNSSILNFFMLFSIYIFKTLIYQNNLSSFTKISMNVHLKSLANMSAETQLEATSALAHQDTNYYPMAEHAKVSLLLFLYIKKDLSLTPIHIPVYKAFFMWEKVWKSTFLIDIDECTVQGVQCGPNQMCFNTRGGYQCLDTPCPTSYQRGRNPG